MELRQLNYFVAVSEELSFSRAAARCFISQSAISHQVARLEHELEVQLLYRSTRSVRLTDAGQRLLPLAKQMIALEATIYSAVRDRDRRVRLTANMSFGARALAAIATIRNAHADTEIEFVIKNFRQRIAAVSSGDCDVALIRGRVDEPGLSVEQLWVEDLVIAVSAAHPLAGQSSVALAELYAYPLLLPPVKDQVLLHKVIRAAFAELGTSPRLGAPIQPDHTATMDLVNHPNAWSVLYNTESAPTGIAFLSERERRLRVPVCAVTPSGTRSPIVAELLAALRK